MGPSVTPIAAHGAEPPNASRCHRFTACWLASNGAIEMRDHGEPISKGQRDIRLAERRALADTLCAVGLFGGVVLVNGILAILLIELWRQLGWW